MGTTTRATSKRTTQKAWLEAFARHVADAELPHRRRTSNRYPIKDGVVRAVVDGKDGPYECSFTLLQVSAEGLMFRGYRSLARGSELDMIITLEDEQLALRGQVVHCTETLGGVKVGIRLMFD